LQHGVRRRALRSEILPIGHRLDVVPISRLDTIAPDRALARLHLPSAATMVASTNSSAAAQIPIEPSPARGSGIELSKTPASERAHQLRLASVSET
jgi:hypothetical protein